MPIYRPHCRNAGRSAKTSLHPARVAARFGALTVLSEYVSKIGRIGGKARLWTVPSEQRRENPLKASHIACARTRKANEKKAAQKEPSR